MLAMMPTRPAGQPNRRDHGFTPIGIVAVLSILVIIGLAMPRYLSFQKKAYKGEAYQLLEELKDFEWGYYQQYGAFTANLSATGFAMPAGSHWSVPTLKVSDNTGPGNGDGGADSVVITTTGIRAPLGATDQVSLVFHTDGHADAGSTF